MVVRWLYGVPRERSYVIDLDTAVDVARRLRELRPNADVQWWVEGATDSRRVEESDLSELSQADRGRLVLKAPEEGDLSNGTGGFLHWNGTSTIPFQLDKSPWISMVQDPEETVTKVLWSIIVDNGRVRRLRHPINWRALVAYLPAVLLSAAMVWVGVSQPLPIPVLALGATVVLFSFTLSFPGYRRRVAESAETVSRNPGHFIRMESRAERAQRRANTKRDVIVALISVAATSILGVIVAFLTGVLPPQS
jgi:hypothetical protein